ncbi:MAG: hypothetical protein H5U00_12890 [Clostridia bacterium]|nr:hypothetical protein [Clostridia bacterium]
MPTGKNRFPQARFVSVTGTPFRSDDRRLEGKEIFRYPLKRAMDMGYTKKMVFRQTQPAELYGSARVWPKRSLLLHYRGGQRAEVGNEEAAFPVVA